MDEGSNFQELLPFETAIVVLMLFSQGADMLIPAQECRDVLPVEAVKVLSVCALQPLCFLLMRHEGCCMFLCT